MPGTRNPVFVRDGTVIGLSICEDIWYAGGPLQEQVIRGGAEVVINLSASPYHAGKAQGRRRMLCTRAADNLAVVCYANLVGAQDEIVYDGNSLIVDEQGQILAEGEMFVEDLVVADVELDAVFNARLHDPRLRKERALIPARARRASSCRWAATRPPRPRRGRPRWHSRKRGRKWRHRHRGRDPAGPGATRGGRAARPGDRGLHRPGARHPRLRAQERIRHGGARPFGRRGFGAHRLHRRRCHRRQARGRGLDALPVHLGRIQGGRRGPGPIARNPLLLDSDPGHVRDRAGGAGAGLQRPARRMPPRRTSRRASAATT